ncbi:hypothetical protein RHGRI_004057 [Rhododendron griersonianum]|uniref:FAR1 domain-containing protein n=1 Tax=Rhododendron griersonianum TaxID=479676 RepID=A0AAV6L868_9ERIC|nr:hypothetical protein RHGRI_004057 [Rhododendron griersonianum]
MMKKMKRAISTNFGSSSILKSRLKLVIYRYWILLFDLETDALVPRNNKRAIPCELNEGFNEGYALAGVSGLRNQPYLGYRPMGRSGGGLSPRYPPRPPPHAMFAATEPQMSSGYGFGVDTSGFGYGTSLPLTAGYGVGNVPTYEYGMDSDEGARPIESCSAGGPILEPFEGLEFRSEEAAKVFSDDYARRVGFVMRVMSCCSSEIDGKILARKLGCNKEGHCLSTQGTLGSVRKQRESTREGCKAMILAKSDKDGKWVVTKFVKDHNHPLVTAPREVRLAMVRLPEFFLNPLGTAFEWQAQQREKTKKLHQQRQVEDEEEERKVDEYCEIGMRLKDYPEDDLRQARQLFQPFSNLLKKWKSLIDVSEVRLKVSLETSPAQRPHGVLDSLFRMWNNSVNCCADGSSGRKHPSEKENGVNQVLDKGVGLSSLPISQESSTSKSRG